MIESSSKKSQKFKKKIRNKKHSTSKSKLNVNNIDNLILNKNQNNNIVLNNETNKKQENNNIHNLIFYHILKLLHMITNYIHNQY